MEHTNKLTEILSKKASESIFTDYTIFLTAYIRMVYDPKFKLGKYRLINSSASTDDPQHLDLASVECLTIQENVILYAFFLALQQQYRSIGIVIDGRLRASEFIDCKRRVSHVLSELFGCQLIKRTSGPSVFCVNDSYIRIGSCRNINTFRGCSLSHALLVGNIDEDAFACIYPVIHGSDGTIVHVGVSP